MGTIPFLALSLVTGIVCDRFYKRTIIIYGDLARVFIGIGFFITLLLFSNDQIMPAIYVVVTLFSVFEAFVATSFSSIVPEVVEKDSIVDINTALNGLMESSRLLGPILGAVIFSFFGIHFVVLLIIACFIVSILFESHLPKKESTKELLQDESKPRMNLADFVKRKVSGLKRLITADARITSLYFNGFATHLFLSLIHI